LKAERVAAGGCHTVIIDWSVKTYREEFHSSDNNLWVCGQNDYGQLGLGHFDDQLLLVQVEGFKIRQIACSLSSTKVIDFNGYVWTCEFNAGGQLGLGDNRNRNTFTQVLGVKAKQISAKNNYTGIIDFNNDMWMWGMILSTQLKFYDKLNLRYFREFKVKQIFCGKDIVIITDFDDNVWGSGDNSCGELGTNDFNTRHEFIQIRNIKGKKVIGGNRSTAIIDMEGNIWVCGNNSSGQLGLGNKGNTNILTK